MTWPPIVPAGRGKGVRIGTGGRYGIEAVNEGGNEQVLGGYPYQIRDKEGVIVWVSRGKDMDNAT